jgi:hypothetical protein
MKYVRPQNDDLGAWAWKKTRRQKAPGKNVEPASSSRGTNSTRDQLENFLMQNEDPWLSFRHENMECNAPKHFHSFFEGRRGDSAVKMLY